MLYLNCSKLKEKFHHLTSKFSKKYDLRDNFPIQGKNGKGTTDSKSSRVQYSYPG